jgi:serine/threonine protein kinase
VYQARRTRCERCEGPLQYANVPTMVAGKFRIVERLGDGAMGVVYRALDVELSRAVAIKTLPFLNAAAASRLRREARVLASVSHPNLAAIYGVESWRGMPMLVLELLSGGTLAARATRGPVPSAEALHYGLSLSDALEVVHRAGILHRDVKPNNIGFSGDGVPKLLDFGVSRLLRSAQREPPTDSDERAAMRNAIDASRDAEGTTTVDGHLVGTPLYLSPEALDAAAPSPAFDIWALCMVLYEIIAGQHPLLAPSIAEVFARIGRCDVPDIRAFLPGADPALAEFFRRAFSPRRAERPETARALQSELRALLSR